MTARYNLQSPLTPEQAAEAVEAVEAAVKDGALWPFPRGAVGRSAAFEAAKALGIDSSTFRHRLRRAHELFGRAPCGMPPKASEPAAAKPKKAGKRPPSIEEERELVRLRDEVGALKKRVKDLHRQAMDDDAIREILTGMARHEPQPVNWLSAAKPRAKGETPQVPMTIWSDWHLGETVSAGETHGVNAYTMKIAEERVSRVIDRTIGIARDHGPKAYPGAVVCLGGDFVSGGLHPELLATDEAEVIPSALRAADIITSGLRRMADQFGRLYVPCAAGNHGRATQKPQFKRYVFKNFDFLIYEMVRKNLAGDSRIVLHHASENEVHFRVFGERFLLTHGDMLGVKGGDGIIGALGPIMRGEIKTGKQMAAIGRDYDILLMGHWHQQLWLPRAIVANTLKGWDEFAAKALRASPSRPSQPLWFVHPRYGITSKWDVMADEAPANVGPREWVSVFA
jgi:hypothetical protein